VQVGFVLRVTPQFCRLPDIPKEENGEASAEFSIASLLVIRPLTDGTGALFAHFFQASLPYLMNRCCCVCHLLDNDLQPLWHKRHKTATVFIKNIPQNAVLRGVSYKN